MPDKQKELWCFEQLLLEALKTQSVRRCQCGDDLLPQKIQPSIVVDFNYVGVLLSMWLEDQPGRTVGQLIIAEDGFTSSLAASRWMIAVCG